MSFAYTSVLEHFPLKKIIQLLQEGHQAHDNVQLEWKLLINKL